MSVLVPYAVVPADRLPPSAGAAGAAPRTVAEGEVALVYDEREEPPGTSRSELLAFAKVLEAVAAETPTLPVRFGTVLQDLGEARDLLRERAVEWQERLSQVAGHVELLVHAYDDRAPRPTPPSDGGGREYLMSRAAARRHTDTMYDDLTAALAPHCREIRRLRADHEVRLACLVPSHGTDGLRTALGSWAGAGEGRRVTTTGPWPPFTFAEEDPS